MKRVISMLNLRLVLATIACTVFSFSSSCAQAPNTTEPAGSYEKLPPQAIQVASTSSAKVTYSQANVEGPYIAITFDDGPSAEHTPRLLDILKARGAKATFFVLGQCVANNPEIAKRIVAEGHEIASHSWSHPQLSKMGEDNVRDQLQRTHDVVKQTTGVTMALFRPPYGAFTQRQHRWANSVWGYKIIMWDVDPLDWKYRSASHVENEIIKGTQNGSIILVHDIHKTSVDAMPATVDQLLKKGFKFVTVSELLKMDKPVVKTPKPATSAANPTAAGDAASAKP